MNEIMNALSLRVPASRRTDFERELWDILAAEAEIAANRLFSAYSRGIFAEKAILKYDE